MSTLLLDARHHSRPVRATSSSAVLRREDRVAVTGGHCPTTGAWAPAFAPSTPIVLRRGELMPPFDGLAVEWHYMAAPADCLADLVY